MYSLSLPGKKQNLPGPGTMRAVMAPVFAVELQIDRAAKTATGTGIDDFFLSKLT